MENIEMLRARLYSVMGLCTLIDAVRYNGAEMLPFASWDSDLGNARGCLEEAVVKLSALCELPAVSGANVVADNNASGKVAEGEPDRSNQPQGASEAFDGTPTTFFKLPQGSADSALTQMVSMREQGVVEAPWGTREELVAAITEGGYDPGTHFGFRVFSSGAVSVGKL